MRSLHPYALPFTRPLHTAAGVLERREGAILRVQQGERVGTGELAPLPGFSPETLDQALAALRVGAVLPSAARFAVELAALDLQAQVQGVPLARLLCPSARVAVPVTRLCAPGEPLSGPGVVKLKVGARPWDEEREGLLRAAESGVRLRLDANRAWDDTTARAVLTELAAWGVECVEEPLARPTPAALASLRGCGVALAADESVRDASDLEALLRAGAVDAVVLKPMFIGGLRAALAMARRAAEAGVKVIVTTALERAPGRLAAAHLAAAVPEEALWPCGLDTGGWLVDPNPGDPTRAQDGLLTLPTAPGLGLPPGWSP